MTTSTRWLIVALLAAGTGGCAVHPMMTDAAYPIYGNPVNPTPVPGYRVECATLVGAEFLLLPGAVSSCRQIIAPADVVLHASG